MSTSLLVIGILLGLAVALVGGPKFYKTYKNANETNSKGKAIVMGAFPVLLGIIIIASCVFFLI